MRAWLRRSLPRPRRETHGEFRPNFRRASGGFDRRPRSITPREARDNNELKLASLRKAFGGNGEVQRAVATLCQITGSLEEPARKPTTCASALHIFVCPQPWGQCSRRAPRVMASRGSTRSFAPSVKIVITVAVVVIPAVDFGIDGNPPQRPMERCRNI